MSKIEKPKFLMINRIMDCGKQLMSNHKLIIVRFICYGTYNPQTDLVEDIYPAIKTVADNLGVSENTVRAAVRAGVALGILTSVSNDDENGRQTSNYICISRKAVFDVLMPVDKAVNKKVKPNLRGSTIEALGVQPLSLRGSTIEANKILEQIILKDPIVSSGATIEFLKIHEEDKVVLAANKLKALGYSGDILLTFTSEVLYHAQTRNQNKTKSFSHAINSAIKCIKDKKWSRPRGMDSYLNKFHQGAQQ